MKESDKASERGRRDWVIILIILFFGFLCVFLAGEWAVRFSPTWKLDTNMRSNLDPDSEFLANRPVNFFEPLDPSILTQPAWVNVFLTPGAVFATRTPAAPSMEATNTPVGTATPLPTLIASPTTVVNPTNTPMVFIPTSTLPFLPPPPSTNTPNPPPTTSPLPSADLSISKDNGVNIVNTGDVITYTVRVTNNGPSSVAGPTLSDPAVTGLSKTAVSCSLTPGQCVTPPTVAQLESGAFILPTLNSGQFYEIAITTNVTALVGSVANTASIGVPSGINDPNPANNSATDTDPLSPTADLRITKSDGGVVVYKAGDVIVYTVIVSNNGPVNVTGATVTDNLPVQITSWDWACTTVTNASGCDGISGSTTGFTDVVDIQSGGSIVYTVTTQVSASPSGSLVNTAVVVGPGGIIDPVPGNNSASDTNELAFNLPYGNIGTAPGGGIYALPSGSSITLAFGSPITVGSHAGYDLVYYEFANGTGIFMDEVILEISDGTNWYTILYWGNGIPDVFTSIDISNPLLGGTEMDNRDISSTFLYNVTGVAMDLEGIGVPAGTYYYIRITAPSGDAGADGLEVDAIEILP